MLVKYNKSQNYEIYKNLKTSENNDNLPKISVITVVKNAEKDLEQTIQNILDQDYKNIEFIIVYTPCEDKTWDIILKYYDYIDKIIINYKTGIYQAFNTGLENANGQWINFMNSGDFFFSEKTITEIFNNNNNINNADIIYGDCKILFKNFSRIIKSKNLIKLNSGMIFSHQSCFVKTEIYKKKKFNLSYIYASDYEFFLDCFISRFKFKKIQLLISKCKSQGLCDINQNIALHEYLKILRKKKLLNLPQYIKINLLIVKFFFIKILNFFIGEYNLNKLRKLYYNLID
jgi:glycosyltransferase involved in cell wall biosynthesis